MRFDETYKALCKTASSRMTKEAFDWDSLKDSFKNLNISDDAKAALVGSLGGAGLGVLAHMVTPKDKDEDLRGRLLSHILTGAALGGLAGYGGSRLYSRTKPLLEPDKPGWYQRNAPELSYSRAATLAGLGTGAYAGVKGLDTLRGGLGLSRLRSWSPSAARGIEVIRGTSPVDIFDPNNASGPHIRRALDALGDANISLRDRILSKLPHKLPNWMGGKELPKWLGGDLIRDAIGRQQPKDAALLDALRELGGRARVPSPPGAPILPVNPNANRILTSRFYNPRKILNSLRRGAGGKKAIWAALIAAGLLGTGQAIRSQNN